MTLIDQFLHVAEAYSAVRQLSLGRISTLIFGDGSRIVRVRDSGADLNTRSFEKAMSWFSDHWPDDAAWPDGIDRPAPSMAEAAE